MPGAYSKDLRTRVLGAVDQGMSAREASHVFAVKSELRGTAFGMVNLLTGLAMLIASVIAGALWECGWPERRLPRQGAAFTVLKIHPSSRSSQAHGV